MFRSSAADKKKALEDEAYTSLCNPGPDLIILDEGHRLRKDKTRLYQILTSVKTRRRVVLTGCVRGACSALAVYGCRRVRLSCSLSLSLHPTPLSLSLSVAAPSFLYHSYTLSHLLPPHHPLLAPATLSKIICASTGAWLISHHRASLAAKRLSSAGLKSLLRMG